MLSLGTGIAGIGNTCVQPLPVVKLFARIDPEFKKLIWVFVHWLLQV